MSKNNKDYGSKKKKRYAEYLIRQKQRDIKTKRQSIRQSIIADKNSTIEELAAAMEIRSIEIQK